MGDGQKVVGTGMWDWLDRALTWLAIGVTLIIVLPATLVGLALVALAAGLAKLVWRHT